MECYDNLSPTSGKACNGTHSVVKVNTNNRTLAISGYNKNSNFATFLEEYLRYRQPNQSEFARFFEDLLPIGTLSPFNMKYLRTMALFSGPIWPFVNEQAVLQSWPVQIQEDTDVWIEQRLEIVEIYFAATTFDKVVKDGRTNFVTKASLIGGMLGLFTGFSVLSGIEILYFSILLLLRICKR